MKPFIVIPAIDLKDGRCVRLRQGRADDAKVYSDDPVAMARHWVKEGARYLHVVDLDGAFAGRPMHTAVIARIAAAAGIPVEVGGGLRTDKDADELLAAGVDRVIVGTRAWDRPEELASLCRRLGPRLAVGIDARGGRVQVRGWVETTEMTAVALAKRVEQMGVETIVYTDTATDGMLAGPNVAAVKAVAEAVSCAVIASGGVSSAVDVRALRSLKAPNLTGTIVGKALYEGKITVADLNGAAEESV